MSFYDRFTQLCKEWDKSPSAVARETRIHKSAPTSWKRGIYPSQKSIRKLAAYFNVSEDYLLGRGIGSVSAKGKDPSPVILSLDKSYFYDDMKLSKVGIGESGKVSLLFEIHESGLSVGDTKDVLETVKGLCDRYGLSVSALMRLTEAAANVMAEKS